MYPRNSVYRQPGLFQVFEIREVLVAANCFFVYLETFQVNEIDCRSLKLDSDSESIAFFEIKAGNTREPLIY